MKQALLDQIKAMEQYVTNVLGPKFLLDSAAHEAELNEFLGTVNFQRGGRLGLLYDERDLELWTERLLEKPMTTNVTIGTSDIKFLGTEHTAKRSRTCKGKRFKNKPREQHRPKPQPAKDKNEFKKEMEKQQRTKKRGHQQAA